MADYQRAVDEIRLFLASSDRTARHDSAELATAYAGACVEANERLKRCAHFLQQGLRSEAVHLAESEPNLLEMVAALDFEERAEWEQVVFSHGWARPPVLMLEAAAALNEAYALADPLRDLLRKHRLLALSRAPLPLRIQVLREIARLDANNAMWTEDLRSYEQVRIKQFKEEVKQATAERNVEALASLVSEIEATAWSGPQAEELARTAKQAILRCTRERARAGLADAENELHAAFIARDVAAARQQQQRWEKFATEAALAAEDPLWGRVQPVLDWIAEQDQRDAAERDHQEAVANLEASLNEEITAEELKELGQAVLANGHEMPKALKGRYRKRLEGLEAGASRRRRLIVRGIAAAALVLALGIGWLVRNGLQEAKATQTVNQVDELLKNENLDEARNLLDALVTNDPAVAVRAPVTKVRLKLKDLQQKEALRLGRFSQALRDLEEAPAGQAEPESLKLANDLARGPAEKESIDRLVKSRKEAFEQELTQRKDSFRARLDALEPKVRELEVLAERAGGNEDVDHALDKVQKEVALLTQESETLPRDSSSARLVYFARKTDQVAKDRISGRRRQELEEKITHAIAPPGAGARPDQVFAEALATYRREFPQEARARAFEKVLAEQPLWKAILDWDEITRGWPLPRTRLSAAEARARVAVCRRYVNEHPLAPNGAAIEEYVKFLAALSRRDPSDPANPTSALLKVFSGDLMTDIMYVKTKDDLIYYVREPPGNEGTITLMYLTDFNNKTETKKMNAGQVVKSGPAPQVDLARSVKSMIKEVELNTWDSMMMKIAEAILKESNVDPLYRLTLVGFVMRNAGEGSYCLQMASVKQAAAIEKAKGGKGVNVPWMNPDALEVRRIREEARESLKHLPSFHAILDEADRQRARIEQSLEVRPRWVGWLVREGGRWQCRTVSNPLGTGSLVVLVPDSRGGKPGSVWMPVGTVTAGSPVLDSSATLAEGRPVFLMTTTAGGGQR